MADAPASAPRRKFDPQDPDVLSGKKLWVEMRTPEGPVYSGHAQTARMPGTKGFFAVLPRHAPLMSSLEVGYTYVRDPVGVEWEFVTGEGFVEVQNNQVLMLVDFAESTEQIDVERAENALSRAKQRLRKADAEVDIARAEAAMQRAATRLRHARRG